MRNDAILAYVAFGAVALAVSGCSQEAVSTPTPGFKDDTGEAKTELAYPAGPYGVGVGSVIANFDFVGYPNAQATTSVMQPISLSDFYNPHGKDKSYQPAAGAPDHRLFPADSGFANAGKAKPVVLNIDIGSVWCGPCNAEAKLILPDLRVMYDPCGGEFLLDLHDSLSPGTPATPKNLQQWTKQYKVNYPGVIDPSYKLDALFAADAYPNNIIVDTTTMTIVTVIAGAEPRLYCDNNGSACKVASDCQGGATCTKSKFWDTYEQQLDKTRAGCMLQ